VDPETSPWVLKVFEWFVRGRMGFSDIARRLRKENAPLPPKVDRWTWKAVKHLLKNRRYIGDWSYGWSETIWQSKSDYGRQFAKEKPAHEYREERLRIVDDALFLAVRERIAAKEGRGGRPTHTGHHIRDIALAVLWCPRHKRKLSQRGASGKQAGCPACKAESEGEQFLYSLLNRDLARRLLCDELAKRLRMDDVMAEMAVEATRRQAERIQDPDPVHLAGLEREVQSLTARITFVFDNPGDTDTDKAENCRLLTKLRVERAGEERKIAEAQAAAARPQDLPTAGEVRQLLDELGGILSRAAESEDEEELCRAMGIVLDLTGGQVVVSQQGERRAKRGWLRGTFRLRLLDTILSHSSRGPARVSGDEVTIDFRESSPAEELADVAKAIWDQGILVKQIADRLSEQRSVRVSRNLVRLAIAHWFKSRGLPVPDGRSRRATLTHKHVAASPYQSIADRVMELFNQGGLLSEIAEELDVDRNTVTAAVRWWHEQRNLPVPDGRTRRKALDRKSRGNPDNDRRAA
jgi:hypothetical protein